MPHFYRESSEYREQFSLQSKTGEEIVLGLTMITGLTFEDVTSRLDGYRDCALEDIVNFAEFFGCLPTAEQVEYINEHGPDSIIGLAKFIQNQSKPQIL